MSLDRAVYPLSGCVLAVSRCQLRVPCTLRTALDAWVSLVAALLGSGDMRNDSTLAAGHARTMKQIHSSASGRRQLLLLSHDAPLMRGLCYGSSCVCTMSNPLNEASCLVDAVNG